MHVLLYGALVFFLILKPAIAAPVLVGEEDGTPDFRSNSCWALKVSNGTETLNSDGTCSINTSGSSGAPSDADYLVGTANGGLSNEIVVGTTPGGELGGTWSSPTIDGGPNNYVIVAAQRTTVSASIAISPGFDTGSGSEADIDQFDMPVACTGKNMYARINVAPSAGQSWIFTLRKGSPGSMADTAVTCTIADAAVACNDTTHTASISAGETVTIIMLESGTAAGIGSLIVSFLCQT